MAVQDAEEVDSPGMQLAPVPAEMAVQLAAPQMDVCTDPGQVQTRTATSPVVRPLNIEQETCLPGQAEQQPTPGMVLDANKHATPGQGDSLNQHLLLLDPGACQPAAVAQQIIPQPAAASDDAVKVAPALVEDILSQQASLTNRVDLQHVHVPKDLEMACMKEQGVLHVGSSPEAGVAKTSSTQDHGASEHLAVQDNRGAFGLLEEHGAQQDKILQFAVQQPLPDGHDADLNSQVLEACIPTQPSPQDCEALQCSSGPEECVGHHGPISENDATRFSQEDDKARQATVSSPNASKISSAAEVNVEEHPQAADPALLPCSPMDEDNAVQHLPVSGHDSWQASCLPEDTAAPHKSLPDQHVVQHTTAHGHDIMQSCPEQEPDNMQSVPIPEYQHSLQDAPLAERGDKQHTPLPAHDSMESSSILEQHGLESLPVTDDTLSTPHPLGAFVSNRAASALEDSAAQAIGHSSITEVTGFPLQERDICEFAPLAEGNSKEPASRPAAIPRPPAHGTGSKSSMWTGTLIPAPPAGNSKLRPAKEKSPVHSYADLSSLPSPKTSPAKAGPGHSGWNLPLAALGQENRPASLELLTNSSDRDLETLIAAFHEPLPDFFVPKTASEPLERDHKAAAKHVPADSPPFALSVSNASAPNATSSSQKGAEFSGKRGTSTTLKMVQRSLSSEESNETLGSLPFDGDSSLATPVSDIRSPLGKSLSVIVEHGSPWDEICESPSPCVVVCPPGQAGETQPLGSRQSSEGPSPTAALEAQVKISASCLSLYALPDNPPNGRCEFQYRFCVRVCVCACVCVRARTFITWGCCATP
jgi:hypothetical protein